MKTTLLTLLFSLPLLLMGCEKSSSDVVAEANTIKVGTIAGPETELMEVAKEVAAKTYGLHVSIIEFTDYIMPNSALADGSIDANMFQHEPYLNALLTNRNYPLISVAKTFVYPVGIYSRKIQQVEDVPEHARVAIPNDPSNEARALLLMQKAGLIKLNPDKETNAAVSDIIDNPKNLRIITMDAAQLPRTLSDVTLAIINTNYAIPAGLHPNEDAIFVEDKDSLYANIIAVREEDASSEKVKQLVSAFQSAKVKEAAERIFSGQAIPAW